MNALPVPTSENRCVVVPPEAAKDVKHRLGRFAAWLDATGRSWLRPDLAAYRDYLLQECGLAPSSVTAHLATIRGRYPELLRQREAFYKLTPPDASPADRKAFVDELVQRIEDALDPAAAPIKLLQRQDRPDADHLRLTRAQARRLLEQPGTTRLAGLRDTAVLALLLCTGLREAELCALDLPDLRQHLGGALALHVRHGKGCKERLIPYGELDWVLVILEAWLRRGQITEGAVFRSFQRGSRVLRPNRLSVRAVQDVCARYPVVIEGQPHPVRPHDLRRTYARRLYEAGVPLVAIQQNLGHADTKTTLTYIGTLDADQRQPPEVFGFDLSKLKEG